MSIPMRNRVGNSKANGNNNDMYGRNSNGYDPEMGNRRNGSGGGSSTRSNGYNDTNSRILEQQNNERIDELSSHVARLKHLTIDIGNEVREQNSLLDNMSDGFGNTRDMLAGSLRRIGTMLESGGARHMCYMVAFCVTVMIFLWWLMSHTSTRGA